MALNLYIDESGSMTENYDKYKDFFVISIIKVKDEKILARNLKRFIGKNIEELKRIDKNGKMFINGKFHELKGSELTKPLKKEFIKAICKKDCLEIFYIKLNNLEVNTSFFVNKARAFNYLLKLFLMHTLRKGYIEKTLINLQIDERNVKTQTKYLLADYLNTELLLSDYLTDPLKVQYYDSANNKFVQVADVFANIFYSNCLLKKMGKNDCYEIELNKLKNDKYLRDIFIFPPNVKK